MIAENAQVADDEFINIFCTPVQDIGKTSSRHVDSSNMHTFYQRHPSEHRWTKDHPLEQVIRNPSQSVRTRRQLESDGEMRMFALTVSRTELKNIKEAMTDSAWIESMMEELHQGDILLVQIYVDDIIFGSTNPKLSKQFEKLMHSKFQMSMMGEDCTSMSSTESEYVSLSACCAQVLWMRTQLTDYGFHFDKIPMYCDSKAAISISCNPVQHSCTKQIDVRYHFIKENVEKGVIDSGCSRKTKKKDTELPQTSGPTTNIADEAINEEMDDHLERVDTTASSLEVEQDSSNINKTQSKATLNEPSFIGTSLGSGLKCQETMGDPIAQTRSENVSKFSNDSLLAGVNTPLSDKDSLKLKELMELCNNLQNKVLDLEYTKTTQALKIDSLKRRVKKLEKKQKSRTYKLKRLYKIGLTARGRFNDQEDAEILFDVVDDLRGEEVFVSQEVPLKEVSVVDEVNDDAVTTTTATINDITLAKTLMELKSAKPKADKVVIQEPEHGTTTTTLTTTTAATTIIAASIRPKAKRVVIHEQEQAPTPTGRIVRIKRLLDNLEVTTVKFCVTATKQNLVLFTILSSADNRPPMLEKDMYDSWKSRMELYMMNRQHGRMILESVENGPFIWPSIEENAVTRPKKYFELSATEAIQADYDVKAINIILQGLHLRKGSKIYKPTNNNLQTSSNTSRANQDNSPRINSGTGYDNQRIGNVAGARENV
nr:Gag-Pol polyprotein [Tanacetum cinerariifolium]